MKTYLAIWVRDEYELIWDGFSPPCTRDRAAAKFGVSIQAVISAWDRLYPNQRRMRVG